MTEQIGFANDSTLESLEALAPNSNDMDVVKNYSCQDIDSVKKEEPEDEDYDDCSSSSEEEEVIYYIAMEDLMDNVKDYLESEPDEEEEAWGKSAKVIRTKKKTPKSDHQCKKCDRFYSNENSLNAHLKRAHLSGDFRCRLCQDFQTRFGLDLYDHHALTHSNSAFTCPECDRVVNITEKSARGDFSEHYRTEHVMNRKIQNQVEVCEICGVSLQTKSALMQHLNVHSCIKPYQCNECDFRTCHKTSLSLHLKKHMREKGVEVHICELCGKSFNSGFHLKEHKLIIHEGKKNRHECKTCGMTFTWISTLARHNAKLHKANREETTCKVCGYVASFKNELRKHERAHKVGEFSCRYCGKILKHSSTHEAHERIHTGENPYTCNKCDFHCRSATILWRHRMEKHDERKKDDSDLAPRKEKTYKCEVCSKTYTRTDGLRDHMNIHLGLKPHKCQLCEYASSHRAGLFMHMKKHRKK